MKNIIIGGGELSLKGLARATLSRRMVTHITLEGQSGIFINNRQSGRLKVRFSTRLLTHAAEALETRHGGGIKASGGAVANVSRSARGNHPLISKLSRARSRRHHEANNSSKIFWRRFTTRWHQ